VASNEVSGLGIVSLGHLAGFIFQAQGTLCVCRPDSIAFNFPIQSGYDYAVIDLDTGEPVAVFTPGELLSKGPVPHHRVYELRPMKYTVENHVQRV
jgi:hypothetical protein